MHFIFLDCTLKSHTINFDDFKKVETILDIFYILDAVACKPHYRFEIGACGMKWKFSVKLSTLLFKLLFIYFLLI